MRQRTLRHLNPLCYGRATVLGGRTASCSASDNDFLDMIAVNLKNKKHCSFFGRMQSIDCIILE